LAAASRDCYCPRDRGRLQGWEASRPGCNMAEEQSTPVKVGTVLEGAYRLTRLLGEGGMGAVYEALHLRLDRRVAVKVMARQLASSDEALARFRREVQVTSKLAHPHIVHVSDFGTAPGGEP